MKSISARKLNRRRFIATTAAAVAMPMILPGCATAPERRTRASNRLTMGVVGWGMQGPGDAKNFLYQDDCQVVAACDLDKNHLQDAVDAINDHYQNQDCKAYHDYRELMARDDLDAVLLAVPDHWHELVATEAARQGKDIYGEKPLARTIAEQQVIVRAVEKHNVIWQTGSWQRSVANFRKAAEIVRNGLIGTVTRVEVGLPSGHYDFAGTEKPLLEKLAVLKEDITSPAQVVPGTPAWNLAVTQPPPNWITTCGSARHRWKRILRQGSTATGDGITTPAADSCSTGSGIIATSRTGAWILTEPVRPKWKATANFRPPTPFGTPPEIPHRGPIQEISHRLSRGRALHHRRRIFRHPPGRQMDRHRRLGLGGLASKFDASNPEWKKYKDLPDELAKIRLYRFQQPLPEFPGLREIPQADYHARGNRASLHHSRSSRPDFHADRPQDSLGREARENHRGPRSQQAPHARLSGTLAHELKEVGSIVEFAQFPLTPALSRRERENCSPLAVERESFVV